MTTKRSGGELVVACLEAQGVDTAFGVPGESFLAVLDGLVDSPIRFIGCRQEGGVTYAAEAWGKLNRKPGIGFVTRGPGATNASVGLHTAMQDSTPMILFVGQASTTHLGREAFQEIAYEQFFGPLVKWVTQINEVDRTPELISRAFSIAQTGRPGPVVVSLPEDVLAATTDVVPGKPVRIAKAGPSPSDVDELLELVGNATKPLVLVGGGGWTENGSIALQQFVEANQLPTATVFRYHDLIDNFSDCYIGDAGVGMQPHVVKAITEADVLLAAGIRFGEMTTGAYTLFDLPDPQQTVIHVHPSERELGKLVQADLPIQSSPNTLFEVLAGRSTTSERSLSTASRADWTRNLRAAHQQALIAPPQPGALDMAEIMIWLQDNLPADVVITNGAGNFSIWPNKHFSYGPDARLLAPQSGSMGYGLPAAIAAKVAEPERLVVCFAGDGDIQMNLQELGTAMQEDAQPVVLVLNNSMYGTIRMHQEKAFPNRTSGTDITNPDFVALGHSYGFHAERIDATDQFADAFARAIASKTGALLELMVPPTMLSPTLSVDDARETGGPKI